MATVVSMRVEIDDRIMGRIQELVPVRLTAVDKDFFADWLVKIGLGTIESALEKHPEMTFRDLFMITLRNGKH